MRTILRATALATLATLGLALGPAPAASQPAPLALVLGNPAVVGGNKLSGTVTLASPAPAGGLAVTVTSGSPTVAGFVAPTLGALSLVASLAVRVPEGATSVSFTVTTLGVPAPTVVALSAASTAGSAIATLAVAPASVGAITFAPTQVTGGTSTTATIALDGAAPAAGLVIALTSNGDDVATVPATVAVRPQARLTSVVVRTAATAASRQVTVSASLGRTASAGFVVLPAALASLQVSPASVVAGAATTGTVTLTGPAPAGGFAASLRADSRSVAMPVAVTVAAGATSATFPITTGDVTRATVVTIYALASSGGGTAPVTDGSSATLADGSVRFVDARSAVRGALLVSPLTVSALLLGPAPGNGTLAAVGGRDVAGLVVLGAPVPAGSRTVTVTGAPLGAITVTIPAGAERAPFTIPTPAVASAVTATLHASLVTTAPLLASSTTSIPDGTSNTIAITEGSAGATLQLLPAPQLQALTASPSQLAGGQGVALTLVATALAGMPTGSVGSPPPPDTARLTVDRPDLVRLPTAVPVPVVTTLVLSSGGTTTVPTAVSGTTGIPSSEQLVTVTATLAGRSASATILVRVPAPAIASFTLSPSPVQGGGTVLASLVPAGSTATTASLTSDHPEIVAVPASVALGASRLATSLKLATQPVTQQTVVTLTAVAGAQKVAARVTVTP